DGPSRTTEHPARRARAEGTLPDPGRDAYELPRRTGRAGAGTHRLGEDTRLRAGPAPPSGRPDRLTTPAPGRGPGSHSRARPAGHRGTHRSEEHTSELQSRFDLVCRLLLEKKKYCISLGFSRR